MVRECEKERHRFYQKNDSLAIMNMKLLCGNISILRKYNKILKKMKKDRKGGLWGCVRDGSKPPALRLCGSSAYL